MMKHFYQLLLLIFLSLFVSCSNDDDPSSNPNPSGAYANGIFVSNEGPFAGGAGSVTFISNDLNTVEQQVYQNVNSANVGNILNAIGFYNDQAYLIANISNRITIVDKDSFEQIGVIQTGLNNPRYFAAWNGLGFVTNWGNPNDNDDDYIAVFDLNSRELIRSIPVAFGPEKILVVGNEIYVAHKGGYGHHNLISVINPLTYEVEKEIEVGDVPQSLVLDNNQNLWVLCEGIPAWTGNETNGSLVRIDTRNKEIILDLDFGSGNHPQHLSGDAGFLYYNMNGNIYAMRETEIELPTISQISEVYFYNLAVKDGILYGLDPKDYASNGSIEIYDMYDANRFIMTIPTGIIPGGIYFN